MILAAIDIGSNAARLLITEVTKNKEEINYTKLNLCRVPLRLGFEVFENGKISEVKSKMFLDCMRAFKFLMLAYKVEALKACATSAMRDAENSAEIILAVKNETNIDIEIITGDLEASLVFENKIAEGLDKNNSYLYIDVGGGSTELSYYTNGVLINKNSFNIGTIRLLQESIGEKDWDEMKEAIKKMTRAQKKVYAIGSGGNINKVFSLSKRKEGKPLTLELLRDYHKELGANTLEERMAKYKLREDRADVIVPALSIYINVMRWAGAEEIFVPKIGLADGLIHHLYEEITAKKLIK